MVKLESKQAFQADSAETPPKPTTGNTQGRFAATKLTATKPKKISKRYDLVDGSLNKTTAAALASGRIETLSLSGPKDFVSVLSGLDNSQVLMLGTATDQNASQIVTRRMMLNQPKPGEVARTGEHFAYPNGPGFLFIDHDGLPDGTYLSLDELLERLYVVAPELRDVQIIAFPSSSSHIYRADTGEDLTGARGVHLYIPVADARDIPRAGQVLIDRLWQHDQGFCIIAKNGNRLMRTVVDAAVWQPNRIIFASGAICGAGIEQRRGDPVVINSDGQDRLDTATALPSPDEATKNLIEAKKTHARAEKKTRAKVTQKDWIAEHRPKQLRVFGAAPGHRENHKTLIAAVEDQVLSKDLVIMVKCAGETTFHARTVGEVLTDPLGYDRALTLDPIEPDYNNNAVVGILYLDGRAPVLHSMAHGGATYRLVTSRTIIDILPGNGHATMQAILDHMRQDKRFFDDGDSLVTVMNGEKKTLDEYSLEYTLSAGIAFYKKNAKGDMVPTDIPPRLLRQLLSMGAGRGLRQLFAVMTHPTITATAKLLDQPGYHAAEGLFLVFEPDDWPTVQADLTVTEACALVDKIWAPFRGFPFTDAASRGAILAAIATAVLRSSFETAPAYMSDGPEYGAGKTLALETIATISSGCPAVVSPPFIAGDESEMRKRFTSMLMSSVSYLIFDNVEGYQHSPTFQAFLTGSQWIDRVLATNMMVKGLSTRVFIGMTGSNTTFSGDLQRRVITWRIDPGKERGAGRVFTWCPKERALASRTEIIHAILSLTLAAQKADLPPITESLGSFTSWERIVRTMVRYVEHLTDGRFADPVPKTLDATTVNDDVRALHHLHVALLDTFSWDRFTAQGLAQAVLREDWNDIADALAGATGRSERLSSKSIGRYMRRFVDRPVWGLVLRVLPGEKAMAYRLEAQEYDGKSADQIAFETLADRVGVPAEIFGSEFTGHDARYRVEAIRPTDEKRPILARDLVSEDLRAFSAAEIQEALRAAGSPPDP